MWLLQWSRDSLWRDSRQTGHGDPAARKIADDPGHAVGKRQAPSSLRVSKGLNSFNNRKETTMAMAKAKTTAKAKPAKRAALNSAPETETAPPPETAMQNCAVLSGIVAYLGVDGAAAASELYQRAFGAIEAGRQPLDEMGRTMHIHLHVNGASLMLSDPFPEHGYPWEKPQGFDLMLRVDDIDAWFKRAADAGLDVVLPVQAMFWGDRYGVLRDRFGVKWSMTQPISK
jgi:PhnB protein